MFYLTTHSAILIMVLKQPLSVYDVKFGISIIVYYYYY